MIFDPMASLVPRIFINFCSPVTVYIERLAEISPGSGTFFPGKGFFSVLGRPGLEYPRFLEYLINLIIYTTAYLLSPCIKLNKTDLAGQSWVNLL